jgi:predicted DNA-binding transcriptional regulator AlpA
MRKKAVTTSTVIPYSLRNFDSLPDSANARAPVVAALFGISEPSVWRWSKSGRLPKPKKIGVRVTVWNVGELRQAQRKAA